MSVSVRVSSCINLAEGFWNVNPSVGTSMVLRRLASLQTMALRWKVRTLLKTLGTGAEYIASSDNKNLASNRGNIKYLGVCVCVFACACVCQFPLCVYVCLNMLVFLYTSCTFLCFVRYYMFQMAIRVCTLASNLSHFSSNGTVCCGRGHGIATYVHLSFDELKLRP